MARRRTEIEGLHEKIKVRNPWRARFDAAGLQDSDHRGYALNKLSVTESDEGHRHNCDEVLMIRAKRAKSKSNKSDDIVLNVGDIQKLVSFTPTLLGLQVNRLTS